MFLKYMRNAYIIKCNNILIIYFLNINVVFCKDYNLQHCIITMIKKWCESVDKSSAFKTLLTDMNV